MRKSGDSDAERGGEERKAVSLSLLLAVEREREKKNGEGREKI